MLHQRDDEAGVPSLSVFTSPDGSPNPKAPQTGRPQYSPARESPMPHTYDYPRPALTVDCAIFAPDGSDIASSEGLEILLVRRDSPPFEGQWATPGGFVEIDEPIETAARRELREETGLEVEEIEEFGVFGTPGRDPRGRIVAVAHWALIDRSEASIEAASDAREAQWFACDDLPELAFDHDALVADARRAVAKRARTGPIGLGVLDEPFELATWRRLYEIVLDREVDADRLGTIFSEAGLLRESGETSSADRTAYTLDRQRYRALVDEPIGWLEADR